MESWGRVPFATYLVPTNPTICARSLVQSLESLAPARRRTKSVGLDGETPVLCDADRTTAAFSRGTSLPRKACR